MSKDRNSVTVDTVGAAGHFFEYGPTVVGFMNNGLNSDLSALADNPGMNLPLLVFRAL